MPEVGNQAPNFTLPDQDLREVVLTEELAEHGTVVLAFFPAAFSSVCTKELCTFRDQLGNLDSFKNTRVLGISVDTPFSLKAFSTQQALGFPLLSDFNRSIRHQEILDDARLEPNYEKLYEVVKAI